MRLSLLILLLLLLTLPGWTQEPDSTLTRETPPTYDSLKSLYPFLCLDSNRLQGEPTALYPFFEKLDRLHAGSGEQAVVVHLGDSHVQAGAFTAPLRDSLQARYGNSGRGVMFPYRVAKSNGPAGYISRCDTPWVYGRNSTIKRPLPTGISGFTLRSVNPSASFTLGFTASLYSPGDTVLVTLYHAHRDTCHTFSLNNSITGLAYSVADSSLPGQTTFLLPDQPTHVRVRADRRSESQRSATFFGMTLSGRRSGVIVHTIGVNGAKFSSYNGSAFFAQQLASLHPDLLIVSLGTNEAYESKAFTENGFYAQIDSLMAAVKEQCGAIPVVLTTPPGIYKSYRHKKKIHYKPNPVADKAAATLKRYAITHGMAYWDWYSIMGGREAMPKWKAKKLTDKKMIHFSGKGYAIQGMLLHRAIMDGFDTYKKLNNKQ
jgi:lysophospholipase L1-like esterase